jgi:hypothetical protein
MEGSCNMCRRHGKTTPLSEMGGDGAVWRTVMVPVLTSGPTG